MQYTDGIDHVSTISDNSAVKIHPVYKPKGITSTEALVTFCKKHSISPAMHAGALDPLAEGLLLIVEGADSADQIKDLTNISKTYVFSGVLGFTTDTWDMLGLVRTVGSLNALSDVVRNTTSLKDELEQIIENMQGTIEQQVPLFSNMRYKNKRMYQWEREGKGHLVPPLIRERTITSISLDTVETVDIETVYKQAVDNTELVHGDFRQEQIRAYWEFAMLPIIEIFGEDFQLPLFRVTATCEKGTYVRSIVHDIGQKLGFGAVTWSIYRTQVGDYTVNDTELLQKSDNGRL